jgi:hypothetical protein
MTCLTFFLTPTSPQAVNSLTWDQWWNYSWRNRRAVTVDNVANSDDLAGYQMLFHVAWDDDMAGDFADVRFTTKYPYEAVGANNVLTLHLDEGAGQTVEDVSGWANDGTLGNDTAVRADDPTWTGSCRFGSCLDFDGEDDHVEVPDSPSLDVQNSITVEAWVKMQAIGENGGVVSKGNITGYILDYDAIYESDCTGNGFQAGLNNVWVEFCGKNISVDRWYHVVFTWDGNEIKTYLNGVETNKKSFTGTIPVNADALLIGTYSLTVGRLNGTIDEVRIYSRALSEAEVKAHYEERERETAYWIESKVNSDYADVWVKVPYIQNNSYQTVYMYYANPAASSTSNGTATFEFFDDFNVDLTKWSTAGGTSVADGKLIVENTATWNGVNSIATLDRADVGDFALHVKDIEFTLNSEQNNLQFGLIDPSHNPDLNAGGPTAYDRLGYQRYEVGVNRVVTATTTASTETDLTIGWGVTVHDFEFRHLGSETVYLVDGSEVARHTTNIPDIAFEILGVNLEADPDVAVGETVKVDTVYVRKYASPEPTYLISEVEEQAYTVQGYTLDLTGSPVDGIAKGTVVESGVSFATQIVNGLWTLNFFVEENREFGFGISLNDTQRRIGHVHMEKWGGEPLTPTALCANQTWRLKGHILYPLREFTGEIRALTDGQTNSSTFTLGLFDFQFTPCLISGRLYTLEVRAVSRRWEGWLGMRVIG